MGSIPSGIRSRGSICCLLSELGFAVRRRIRGLRGGGRQHGLGRGVRWLLDRLDEDGSAWLTDVHAGGLLHRGVAVRRNSPPSVNCTACSSSPWIPTDGFAGPESS